MCCDPNAQIVLLSDQLTGALVGLARAADGSEHLISEELTQLLIEALFSTRANASSTPSALEALIARAREQKRQMVPNCFTCAMPCGRTEDYDLAHLHSAPADSRSLRYQILQSIRDMAACAHPAWALGCKDDSVNKFLYKALFAIGRDDWGPALLMPIVLEAQKLTLQSKALLENARLSF